MPPSAKSILERRERAIREGRRKDAKLTEYERRVLRRLRNRESAERCRLRRLEEAAKLEQRMKLMQEENDRLIERASRYEQTILQLHALISRFSPEQQQLAMSSVARGLEHEEQEEQERNGRGGEMNMNMDGNEHGHHESLANLTLGDLGNHSQGDVEFRTGIDNVGHGTAAFAHAAGLGKMEGLPVMGTGSMLGARGNSVGNAHVSEQGLPAAA